jgi:hypothetical protein
MGLAAVSIEYRINDCYEDVTIEVQLLVSFIGCLCELNHFLKINDGKDKCNLLRC